MGKSALLSNGKGSNADKVQDSDTSCLGLVLELLATTACTSYSNSLSESVRFLESQLQAERHRSAVLRQEAEGLRKSLEHSDAYFLVQQQALEDFSAKQDKANKTAKEDYLEDSETTPKSCLGLVFELLATTACTSYSNSLSESVRFLESQLQAKRHRSAVLRQEAEGLRKSLEHSDAYFLVQQQALEDFSTKQDKANQLAKLIASMVDTQYNVS